MVTLKRKGGLGDVVMMTPLPKVISKATGRSVKIISDYKDIFLDNPYLNGGKEDGMIIDLDGVYEKHLSKHPTYCYLQEISNRLGCPELMDMPLEYELHYSSHDRENKIFLGTLDPKRKTIVIHFNERWCRLDFGILDDLMRILSSSYNLITIGTIDDQSSRYGINLQPNNWPILRLASLINLCDCYIGTDSGLLHVAGCTNTPIVGLFGPIPPCCRLPLRKFPMFVPIGNSMYCDIPLKAGNPCLKEKAQLNDEGHLVGFNCDYWTCSKSIHYNQIISAMEHLLHCHHVH